MENISDKPTILLKYFIVVNRENKTHKNPNEVILEYYKVSNISTKLEWILSIDINRRRAIQILRFKRAIKESIERGKKKEN